MALIVLFNLKVLTLKHFISRVIISVQQNMLLLKTMESLIRMLVQILTFLLPIQLSSPGKALEDVSST